MKNFPGVDIPDNPGYSILDFEILGAGEPDKRTLLTDLLNALTMGVDNIEAIEVTLDKVFFLLLSTPLLPSCDKSDVLEFKMLELLSRSSTIFFLFLFLN